MKKQRARSARAAVETAAAPAAAAAETSTETPVKPARNGKRGSRPKAGAGAANVGAKLARLQHLVTERSMPHDAEFVQLLNELVDEHPAPKDFDATARLA